MATNPFDISLGAPTAPSLDGSSLNLGGPDIGPTVPPPTATPTKTVLSGTDSSTPAYTLPVSVPTLPTTINSENTKTAAPLVGLPVPGTPEAAAAQQKADMTTYGFAPKQSLANVVGVNAPTSPQGLGAEITGAVPPNQAYVTVNGKNYQYTPPQPSPSTPSNGSTISGYDQSGNPIFSQPAQQPTIAQSILQRLGLVSDQQAGQGAYTQQLQQQYNLPGAIQAKFNTFNDYQRVQEEANNQIRELEQTNPTGASGASAVAAIENAKSIIQHKVASYAIAANAAAGNLEATNNIIDSQVKAIYEPLKTQVENLKTQYELNQSNLSDSEKVAAQTAIFKAQNQFTQLTSASADAQKTLADQGLYTPAIGQKFAQATTLQEISQIKQDALQGTSGGSGSGTGTSNIAGTSTQPNEAGLSTQAALYVDHSSDGVPYVDQDRLQNLAPTVRAAISQNLYNNHVRILDNADVQALTTIDEAKKGIQLFQNAANDLLTSGFKGRLAGFSTNVLGQALQLNPEWRDFQSLRSGLIKAVQGAAAGAPGLRVTGVELSTAANALPTSFDNKESAMEAIKTFNTQLNINRDVLLRGSAPSNSNNVNIGGNNFVQDASGKWVVQ